MSAESGAVHTAGRVNPNWPLCVETFAVSRGWTTDEIEDGELADDPLISGPPHPGVNWFVERPANCHDCRELVHA